MSANDNVKEDKELYDIYIKNVPCNKNDEIFYTFCIMKIFNYNIDIAAKIVIEGKVRRTLAAVETLEKAKNHSVQLFALGIDNEFEKSV